MFAAVMEDEDICRGVLERILGIPIKHVTVRSEVSLFINSDYRGVQLDVQTCTIFPNEAVSIRGAWILQP